MLTHARALTSLLLALTLSASGSAAQSALELGGLFGDHMLAAAGQPLRVWGGAFPGETVSGTLWTSYDGRSTAYAEDTQADSDGAWSLVFPAQPAGLGHQLTITSGAREIVVRDLAFGDLWICSGQSNMEWPLAQTDDAEASVATAERELLRLYVMPRRVAEQPRRDAPGQWVLCTPESAAKFSAVGYHFGRALSERLGRPIGLVQSAWGGTPAEAWTPRATLESSPQYVEILEREVRTESWTPAGLYNGMLHPLLSIQPRGVIWYQGESNAGRAEQYASLFSDMIGAWREAFEQPQLPFLFVQLANFRARAEAPGPSDWAELRESQAAALALPATGMAVAIDIGEADDIHPRDKRTVGERLALEAARLVYGIELDSRGPRYRRCEVQGGSLRVEFDFAEGLATRDGATPAGFALAGEDQVFHWAEARIDGTAVVLTCAAVPAPLAVRFAWADNPAHNLVDGSGLPAEPFRSDTWPGVTAGKR